MNNKPNQTIDEIFNLVYPPSEAILPQLYSIKTIAASASRVYDATEDIHSIFPNLDAMQKIIDYLRGAPLPDDLKPLPEDTLKPVFFPSSDGFNIITSLNRNGEYDVSIIGLDVEPKITHPELFGDILNTTDIVEVCLEIPVICGRNYLVTQNNPVLSYYEEDKTVKQYGDEWVKEKIYTMDEDNFQYAFLLQEGRSKVKISIFTDYENPIIFNVTSHLHFKKEELVPPETGEGEGDNDNEVSSLIR